MKTAPAPRARTWMLCLLLGLSPTLAACGGSSSSADAGFEPVEETVELVLRARDAFDQPIPMDARGVTTLGVGEAFVLELSYVDHRPSPERIGASRVFVDLLADQANVLRPVIGETLRLIVGEEIRTADPAGTITFFLEGSADRYESTGGAFRASPESVLTAALARFGYTVGVDYVLSSLSLAGDGIGLQIHWDSGLHGSVDMPDLLLGLDFPQPVSSQIVEFAPFQPDGVTLNPEALRLSLDTRSRSFNGGEPFYDESVEVNFDAATGFTRVGGMGPEAAGGVPALSNDGMLAQPFDAFRLRVVVIAPVSGMTIRAAPTLSGKAIVMYGTSEEVPEPDIRLDGDHALIIDAVGR